MQEIADRVFVETEYQGVNVGVVATDKGLVCIDVPSYPREARHWAAQLNRRFPRPVRYLILTDASGDRVLNTRWIPARIITHQSTADRLGDYDRRYPPRLIESLIERNSLAGKEFSSGPVERASVSFTDSMILRLGDHELRLNHAPGPSQTTIWVRLPNERVMFCSDTLSVGTHPPLEESDLWDWQNSLNQITIEGARHSLVPGRGPVVSSGEGTELMQAYLDQLKKAATGDDKIKSQGASDGAALARLISYFDDDTLPVAWVERQLLIAFSRIRAGQGESSVRRV